MTYLEDFLLDNLLLPGDRDCSAVELCVKVLVPLVQVDILDRRELLNVQNILQAKSVEIVFRAKYNDEINQSEDPSNQKINQNKDLSNQEINQRNLLW